MIIRATQKKRMSKPVTSTSVGIEVREVRRLIRPAEHRERPELRREPRVEHVRVLLELAGSAGRAGGGSASATVTCPSVAVNAGMRWPHQSWREMHQSWMLRIHSKYVFVHDSGDEAHRAVLDRRGSRAPRAAGSARTTASRDTARSRCRTAGSARRVDVLLGRGQAALPPRAARRPALARLEAVQAGVVARLAGHLPVGADDVTTAGRPCRCRDAKSFASCAGVIFTMPVPNSRSTRIGSSMTGIRRPRIGRIAVFSVEAPRSGGLRDGSRARCRRASSRDASSRRSRRPGRRRRRSG